ncbi:MAG: hydantoinase/oxoprolinase family protein, partial [Solirubrobacterales bacterium]|nr:hydantoinase/oxoprolinase family protein [Solirubrobacterales bacterium]
MRIATDVGGTFTDLVAFDEQTGGLIASKVSTTPSEFSRGVMASVEAAGVDLAEASFFVHGCTVVINAITERKGARTALVTTEGFRDVLLIGRGNRPDMYNLRYHKPEPFVPRRLCFEVPERVDHHGAVVEELDDGALDPLADRCAELGVEAIAVCFLHSYANPDHERAARDRLAARLPDVAITISSDVTRQMREYERSSTTILNAYVQPVLDRYLTQLQEGAGARGLSRPPYVMQSNGGTASFDRARRTPINMIESGPAAGIMGAARIGREIGEPNVIYLDIGGTTAKCSLIEDGKPLMTTEYKLEWSPQSAGYPANVPVTDIVEIGAGGGSIAWVDDTGGLHVGPRSAGAEPGPACYGKGGTAPTVTDAKLLAGVIDPGYFLGGRLKVSRELALEAIGRLGEVVGTSPEETANGIIRLANARMINALRLVSVRRGYDPRDFVLVACGGGGAMHAAALGAELRVKRTVIPPLAGNFSAWGMLVTEPRIDLIRTHLLRTDGTALPELAAVYDSLHVEAQQELGGEGGRSAELVLTRSMEMRYAGQEHTVSVLLDDEVGSMADVEQRFHRAHERLYTFALDDTPVEIVNFHLTGHLAVPTPAISRLDADGRSPERARKPDRRVDFDADGFHECAVYERELLPAGFSTEGPAVVEESTSTTLVHPGQRVTVDEWGNLLIDAGAA